MQESTLILPSEVVSPMDIARILRELENLDEFFRQSELRQPGQAQNAPRYSRLLDSLVVANKVNLLDAKGRQLILDEMNHLKERAPIMHMSFSVDPPGPYVQKIVTWLRTNIDTNVLVRVGLQPNIGAGCVVRTKNKSFDFSLRKYFDDKKEFFAQKLHEAVSEDLPSVDKFHQDSVSVGTNYEPKEAAPDTATEELVPEIASGFGLPEPVVTPEELAPKQQNDDSTDYQSVAEPQESESASEAQVASEPQLEGESK